MTHHLDDGDLMLGTTAKDLAFQAPSLRKRIEPVQIDLALRLWNPRSIEGVAFDLDQFLFCQPRGQLPIVSFREGRSS